MEKERMYIPSGLKTRDGKDIMCYTSEFYIKNKEKIEKLIRRCEKVLKDDQINENKGRLNKNDNHILKENYEKYDLDIHIDKKHDKLFKEILSDRKEAVKFINHYLNLSLIENDIEKYEKEFRTQSFSSVEADVVYKIKNKNVFILIEHQSSVDLKMSYRILCYKNAIVESAIDKKRLKERNYKIPKVIAIVLYTGKREWNMLSIRDIEEKIEGYEETENEYTLIDTNKLSREVLLEDNLITSKAMLIEKARNKAELYKNIEDMINNQKRIEKFENSQLEKIVKYELAGTEDESIINKFIEKIRNREEKDEIMMNAARIINKEIRKQRKEGMEQGILQGKFMIAKKLKGRMTVEEISQITGLSKKEIEEL